MWKIPRKKWFFLLNPSLNYFSYSGEDSYASCENVRMTFLSDPSLEEGFIFFIEFPNSDPVEDVGIVSVLPLTVVMGKVDDRE